MDEEVVEMSNDYYLIEHENVYGPFESLYEANFRNKEYYEGRCVVTERVYQNEDKSEILKKKIRGIFGEH